MFNAVLLFDESLSLANQITKNRSVTERLRTADVTVWLRHDHNYAPDLGQSLPFARNVDNAVHSSRSALVRLWCLVISLCVSDGISGASSDVVVTGDTCCDIGTVV